MSRNPPDKSTIQRFEDEFQVYLPNDYVALLMSSNGGHPELSTFIPTTNESASDWSVDYFYWLDSDIDNVGNLWSVTTTYRPYIGPEFIPFADDGGGNQFLVKAIGDSDEVYIWVHDEKPHFRKIANSFAEFIDGLYIDPDYI